MYELMTGLFALIMLLDIYAMLRYGFNVIFLYIGLFSLLVVVWGVIAIRAHKKDEKNDGQGK